MDASLFVSETDVHKREVRLPSGSVHTLWFRDLTQKDFRDFRKGNASKDEDEREAASARLVARSLCEPDGSDALTLEQALKLKPAALLAIQNAVLQVNEYLQSVSSETRSREMTGRELKAGVKLQ